VLLFTLWHLQHNRFVQRLLWAKADGWQPAKIKGFSACKLPADTTLDRLYGVFKYLLLLVILAGDSLVLGIVAL
jgi:hypothetical protein